ncbi:MAG: CotH kinase family protein [Prolixibacteraceae bacterium]
MVYKQIFILFLFIPFITTGQVKINELLASNSAVNADPDYQKYSDWVELYNSSGNLIDLGGYFLSDSRNELQKWQFPAGTKLSPSGYLLVYADEKNEKLHLNFKLNKSGETLYLTNTQGAIIDSVAFSQQQNNISFGRSVSNPSNWNYYKVPTPGMKNGGEAYQGIAATPNFSIQGGIFISSQQVRLSTVNNNSEIYYSLDGSEPDKTSSRYTTPIDIEKTSVIRAISYETNMLPSLIYTQTYLVNEDLHLPVISISTSPENFFSDETGIYVKGTNGVAGYCTAVPHNLNQDWERPINIEFYESDGTLAFNQQAGARIFGGCSRIRYPQKSLAIYARKKYENTEFAYPIFDNRKNDRFDSFVLRSSSDDQPFTMFRDALTQTVVSNMIDVDFQAYRPTVVFINGVYWGIHNIRENLNENYLKDNYGIEEEDLNLIKRNPAESWNVEAGSATHYNNMINYLEKNDITKDAQYDYIKQQMDVDEYINYQIIQIFFAGNDWPGNNIRFWRSEQQPFNRWRWMLYDLDWTFTNPNTNVMAVATQIDCNCSWPNPPWSTYLFRRLLQNETFKNEFIQRFALYSETLFKTERLIDIVDSLQQNIAAEIPRHITRWGGQKVTLPDNNWMQPTFNSVITWNQNVEKMRTFAKMRHGIARQQLMDYFGIKGSALFSAETFPEKAGVIKAGEMVCASNISEIKLYKSIPIKLSAIALSGFQFLYWEANTLAESDKILIEKGAEWKYNDTGTNLQEGWRNKDYSDSGWKTGKAQLGYGDNDESTTISFGPSSNNKYITTYFRKTFEITDDLSLLTSLSGSLLRDDGAVVYLNGTEVFRSNMPEGTIIYSTLAGGNIGDENTFITFNVDKDLLKSGKNVLAVEVHQNNVSSSDLSFDMELQSQWKSSADTERFYTEDLDWMPTSDTRLVAHFEENKELLSNLFINEIVAKNVNSITDEMGEYEDWIELYNNNSEAVNVGGLLLSDDQSFEQTWPFPVNKPENTTIQGKGFLIVFADNEPDEGPLHATFKLNADGERLFLLKPTSSKFEIIDSLVYSSVEADFSWSRFPDGGNHWYSMLKPTPAASNIQTNHTEWNTNSEAYVYPNPTNGIFYVKNAIESEESILQISVYDFIGRMVFTEKSNTSISEVDISDMPNGVYLVKLKYQQKSFVKKLMLSQ